MTPEGSDRALAAVAVTALALASAWALWAVGAPRRDSWWVIGADTDLSVVVARITTGNTNVLAGQAETRVTVLPTGGSPIEHRAVHARGASTAAGAFAEPDRITAVPEGWELRVGGAGLGARLSVLGAAPGCPATAGALAGTVSDPADGRLLSGGAVVVRTVGPAGAGAALYVVGPRFAAAIDPAALACPAWVWTPDTTWTGDAPPAPRRHGDSVTLGAWTLTLDVLDAPVEQPGVAHLLPVERTVAAVFGGSAGVTLRRAVVGVRGREGARALAGVSIVRQRGSD